MWPCQESLSQNYDPKITRPNINITRLLHNDYTIANLPLMSIHNKAKRSSTVLIRNLPQTIFFHMPYVDNVAPDHPLILT